MSIYMLYERDARPKGAIVTSAFVLVIFPPL
jgi:hypothetical protein